MRWLMLSSEGLQLYEAIPVFKMFFRDLHLNRYLLMSALLMSSCTIRHNNVEERKRYWEEVVHSEIPIGSSFENVRRWTDSRRLSFVEEQNAHTLVAGLEYVPVNDLVCKGFGLSLRLTFDPDRHVAQETVNSFGNCL
jgi:hypothetical protein